MLLRNFYTIFDKRSHKFHSPFAAYRTIVFETVPYILRSEYRTHLGSHISSFLPSPEKTKDQSFKGADSICRFGFQVLISDYDSYEKYLYRSGSNDKAYSIQIYALAF